MEISESQIIGRIQNGNLEEFGKLYDLYIKKIYDFIYYKTGHKQTAEDLTSQTFFKALKSINTFKISKIEKETGEKNNKILRDTNFSAWLYRIARNTVIDHHRTKKETKNLDELTDIFFEKDIDYDIDIQQKLEQVKKYLENFKPQHREIIIMRLWDNLSYKEIAEIIGLTETNCRLIFSRSIGKLREDISMLILWLILIINGSVF